MLVAPIVLLARPKRSLILVLSTENVALYQPFAIRVLVYYPTWQAAGERFKLIGRHSETKAKMT